MVMLPSEPPQVIGFSKINAGGSLMVKYALKLSPELFTKTVSLHPEFEFKSPVAS